MNIRRSSIVWRGLLAFAVGLTATTGSHSAPAASACKKIVLNGEVNAGQEWETSLGQGWQFRLLPIPTGQAGYSGWDLVVDRDHPSGYPDALLLATPPYNSINEREIGTTFGLRAQDAIGWNPRTFHFLVDPAAFDRAKRLFLELEKDGQLNGPAPRNAAASRDFGLLLQLQRERASGELRIENSRLHPGISDAAPFAQAWALAGMRAQHQIEPVPDGKPSPHGEFVWMRFSVTLWLPASWRLPADLHGVPAACVP